MKCKETFNQKILLGVIFLIAASCLPLSTTQAQGKKRIIQLSGIILGEDSVSGIPGVHVYVPKAGRGTSTNRVGYFSMPTLVGDSVVISSVGYERQYYIVPDADHDNLTIIVEMVSDTTFLETVEIMPFPTEKIFKEAVLALNIPISDNVNEQNLNEELLALMLSTAPPDGGVNHRFYMQNWAQAQNNRFGPPANPLLNPFNWAQFFKSLKSKKN